MTNWKTYRLGDICTLNYGKALTATNRVAGDIPVYSSAGITGSHNVALVQSKGIIVGRKGTVGTVYYSDKPFYCIDTAYYILPDDEKYDFKWLYYRLKSLHLDKLNEDSAVPGLNRETAYAQEFPLPPLEEQRRIAGILGAIDDKIENNRRINTNLELQAQALYKQWFVDNRKDDWEKKKLESIIDIGSGKGLARIDFVEDGLYPILGANGQIGRTNNFLIDKKDNVLFTGRVGTLGNVFRLQQKRAWLSDNTLIITPKKKYYNYVYFFLKSSNLKDFNVGSTQPLIRQSDIKEMDILIPDYLTLEAFENKCIAMFDKINQANAEIDSLATLRDTLLPKLMNGEIITK